MRRYFVAALFFISCCFPAQAQISPQVKLLVANPINCPQAQAWIARTTALTPTEQSAYTGMICGMVIDGTWCGPTFDAFYIFATNTTTTANLNLCSTSFGLSQTGTVTFAADKGYTGNGSTGFLDTGYLVNSNLATLNSTTAAVYGLTVGGAASNAVEIGSGNTALSTVTYIAPNNSGGSVGLLTAVNTNTSVQDTGFATTNGFFVVSRTTSNATNTYFNGAIAPLLTSAANAGALGTMHSFLILAARLGASAAPSNFSPHQVSAAIIGPGWTATTQNLISNRVNGYMRALGINQY